MLGEHNRPNKTELAETILIKRHRHHNSIISNLRFLQNRFNIGHQLKNNLNQLVQTRLWSNKPSILTYLRNSFEEKDSEILKRISKIGRYKFSQNSYRKWGMKSAIKELFSKNKLIKLKWKLRRPSRKKEELIEKSKSWNNS